ncbi:MAG: hypothetical protein FJ029_03995 [Actinobacteria bacterium]|nr:hypothetical protein [Actinomycetota bacterium]
MAGAAGLGHGVDWHIADPVHAYLNAGKTLAMTAIDLLFGSAEGATAVLDGWKAPMTKSEYLAFQRGVKARREYAD